jgi:hypothetical protein
MRRRLGELLIECGVIDERQLRIALAYQEAQRCRLGTALVDLGFVAEEQVVATLARKLGIRRADLDELEPGPELDAALQLVPRELACSRGIFPVAATRSMLVVAAHDPTNLAVVDELAFRLGRRVEVLIAGERELARTIARLYDRGSGPIDLAADDGEHASPELELVPGWAPVMEEQAAPAAEAAGDEPGTDRERLASRVLDELLHGSAAPAEPSAARLTAALVRLLTRAGVVDRRELEAELARCP